MYGVNMYAYTRKKNRRDYRKNGMKITKVFVEKRQS